MIAAVIDDNATLLRQPIDLEGREEKVQNAGMVAVLHVLEVELPIVRENLSRASKNFHWPPEDTSDARRDFLAEIGFEFRSIVIEAAEYETAKFGDLQFSQVVLRPLEVFRHSALPPDTALKGNTRQVAGEVVAPAVIHARDVIGVAAPLQTEERAAVSATINKGMQLTALCSRDHDGALANAGDQIVAGIGDLNS